MSDEVEPGFVRVRLDLSLRRQGLLRLGEAGRRAADRAGGDRGRAADRDAVRRETYELTVAGRTDAGVHARGQVAHVDLPAERVGRAPGEAAAAAGRAAAARTCGCGGSPRRPAGFNARFSAIWRRYAYRVADHPGGVDPLLRGHVLWHDWPLDVDAMNEAAGRLVGEHDFAAYCKKREGATTIRTLQQLELGAGRGRGHHRDRAGRRLLPQHGAVAGRARCCSWGTGTGRWSGPAKVLAAGVRDSAVHVVRPHGLTLEEVGYPADELLAARSQEARNVRTLPGRRLLLRRTGLSGTCSLARRWRRARQLPAKNRAMSWTAWTGPGRCPGSTRRRPRPR